MVIQRVLRHLLLSRAPHSPTWTLLVLYSPLDHMLLPVSQPIKQTAILFGLQRGFLANKKTNKANRAQMTNATNVGQRQVTLELLRARGRLCPLLGKLFLLFHPRLMDQRGNCPHLAPRLFLLLPNTGTFLPEKLINSFV